MIMKETDAVQPHCRLEIKTTADANHLHRVRQAAREVVVRLLPMDGEQLDELRAQSDSPVQADFDPILAVPIIGEANVIEADSCGRERMERVEARGEDEVS